MDQFRKNIPPRLMLSFFRWFCHPECREDIEGDLLERFHSNSTQLSSRKAKWLFTKDVLLLFRPGIIRGFKNQETPKPLTMKKISWIKLIAINLAIIFLILLPFFPGPPNKLVIGISAFAQAAGFVGLILIPIGIVWAIIEIINFKKKKPADKSWKPSYYLAIAATFIISILCLLLLLATVISGEIIACILVVLIYILAFRWTIKKIRSIKASMAIRPNPAPLYLITIPLLSFITRSYIVDPISDYSRNYAIQRSQVLITSIEDYRKKNGVYPASIEELEGSYLEKVPSPFVMGILNFRYNKIDDHYSLSFSQWLEWGSLEEIVLYDKGNLHKKVKGVMEYDYNFDLHRVNGAFAIHKTGYDNWTYYQCD